MIPPPSGYQLFTPVIDTFLKEHLFADIFARDNLDVLSRGNRHRQRIEAALKASIPSSAFTWVPAMNVS